MWKKEKQLKNYNEDIDDFEKKIKWFVRQNEKLEKNIRSDQNNVNKWEKVVRDIRNKLGDEKEDNSEVNKEINQVRILIKNVKTAIKRQESQIVYTKRAIQSLENNLSKLTVVIEKSIYECRDVEIVDYNYGGNNFFGYIQRNDFFSYLQNLFGRRNLPSLPDYDSRVQVHNVNIYSQEWSAAYGATYSYGSNLFQDGFSCRTLQANTSYYGRIVRIQGNRIIVEEEGGESSLFLSSCTNIQTSTGNRLPRKGDRIAFKGDKRNIGRNYNVKEAMCY